MIRVAIVDDHHAMRLGLHTALRSEPGIVPVGTASSGAQLAPMLYSTQPDVVLLDYTCPTQTGLLYAIASRPTRPGPPSSSTPPSPTFR